MNKKTIACVGSGTIGSSWALSYAMAGYNVFLYDINDEALNHAEQIIKENIKFLMNKEILNDNDEIEIVNRIKTTTDLQHAVSNAWYIQESGPENYDIKQNILSKIDEYADPKAIYASSTSGLLIDKIAEKSKYPGRCIGAHPYNPPHLIPLVEISYGNKTEKSVYESAYAFLKNIGKEPVILNKQVMGFIGNRLSFALYRELISLVKDNVCSIEDADRVVQYGLGLRWATLGPVMLYDLGGGEAGLRGMSKLDFTLNKVFADLSTMTEMPSDWYDIAEEGLKVEKNNFILNNEKTPKDHRDDTLLELLKINKKFVKGEM